MYRQYGNRWNIQVYSPKFVRRAGKSACEDSSYAERLNGSYLCHAFYA